MVIDAPDIKKLQRLIKKAGDEGAIKASKEATKQMALAYKKKLKAAAPVKSGFLRRFIKHSVRKGRKFDCFNAKIGILNVRKLRKQNFAGAMEWPFYAYFTEKGTKGPYRIPNKMQGRGRSKRLNTFAKRLSIGGNIVTTVQHPGIDADPWIEPTFKVHRRGVARLGIRVFEKELRKYIK